MSYIVDQKILKKYYRVCELFDDNLFSVESAMLQAKNIMNKNRVYEDLEKLLINKYEAHFDIILSEPERFTKKYNLIVLEG